MYGKAPMKIFSCRATKHLAQRIANELGMEMGKSSVTEFSDGDRKSVV
jgi:phosphoribosylpyrophosphate synthetase